MALFKKTEVIFKATLSETKLQVRLICFLILLCERNLNFFITIYIQLSALIIDLSHNRVEIHFLGK